MQNSTSPDNLGLGTWDLGLSVKDARQLINIRSHTARWQAFEKESPVGFRSQAWVEDGKHALVRRAANQSSKSLLQTDDRLRNAVFVKARSALIVNISLTRGNDRIGRHGERQLVYDDARQLRAAHVNALPET